MNNSPSRKHVYILTIIAVAVFLLWNPLRVPCQERGTLLPQQLVKAIISEVSGEIPLEHIRSISQFHRLQASLGYHQAAEYVSQMAKAYGLQDVHIESFPADGETYYYMYKSSPAWDARRGELWLVEPEQERITSFAETPVSLCPNSSSTDVTGELVWVGAGVSEMDYQGKDVQGKIVLASGSAGAVHQEAVFNRGALGVVSCYVQRPYDDPDMVNTGSLRPYQPAGKRATFGFAISHRKGTELKERLQRGERLVVRAIVEAELHPAHYEVVVATIPGTDLAAEEILFTAHLCHYKPGSVDNASGSASLLEVARTIKSLLQKGKIPPLRRTIRFLWVPEMSGSIAYAARHPEVTRKAICGINMDMVGQYLNDNNSTYFLHQTPHSIPHFVNDVAADFMDYVGWGNTETLTPRLRYHVPILSPSGSRDAFRYKIDEYVGGSDQWIFNDGLIGVPMVFFLVWPDTYYHTSKDSPDKCDPTTLRRGSFIATATALYAAGAGADDAVELGGTVHSRGLSRIATEMDRALHYVNRSEKELLHTAYKEAQNIVIQSYLRERRALSSIKHLTRGDEGAEDYLDNLAASLAEREKVTLRQLESHYHILCQRQGVTPQKPILSETEQAASKLVPVRNEELKGPLGFSYLEEKLNDPTLTKRLKIANRDSRLLYEILNFIDGKRTLLDIRQAVSAEYQPVPLEEVEEFLQVLASAGVIQMK